MNRQANYRAQVLNSSCIVNGMQVDVQLWQILFVENDSYLAILSYICIKFYT